MITFPSEMYAVVSLRYLYSHHVHTKVSHLFKNTKWQDGNNQMLKRKIGHRDLNDRINLSVRRKLLT